MEIFFMLLFACMIISPIVAIGRHVIEPYMNGMKFIDRTKHPVLSRAQRIIRANNVKAREAQAKTKLAHFNGKRLAIEAATEEKIIKARQKSMTDHANDAYEWDCKLAAITAEEDARKRREASIAEAKKRAAEEISRAEIRDRELAIWTANENARLARFEAEQRALQAEEDRKVAQLLQSRENELQALSKHHVGGPYNPLNSHRMVMVHSLYLRKLPTTDSRKVDSLPQNSWVTVDGWIDYEPVWGNSIWFRLANGQGWVWSGGLSSLSTVELENLNYMKEPGETFELRGGAGDLIRTITEPSTIASLIQAELDELKSEMREINSRISQNEEKYRRTESPLPTLKKKKKASAPNRSATPIFSNRDQITQDFLDGNF